MRQEQADALLAAVAAITEARNAIVKIVVDGVTIADPTKAEPKTVAVTAETLREYPRVVAVNGKAFRLKAPINNRWFGGGNESIAFELQGLPLNEPSNAPDGYPLRSPAGFPLSYPIGGDGLPAGPARILVGQALFDSDTAANAYIDKVTRPQSESERAAIEAEWADWNRRMMRQDGSEETIKLGG